MDHPKCLFRPSGLLHSKNIRRGCIFAHAILHTEQNILAMDPLSGAEQINGKTPTFLARNFDRQTKTEWYRCQKLSAFCSAPFSGLHWCLVVFILSARADLKDYSRSSISQKWNMQSVVVKQKPNSNFINRTVERLKMQLATANVNHSISQHFGSQLIYKLHQRIEYVWNCRACDSSMINPFNATFPKRIRRREYFEFLHICGDTMALIRLLCYNFRNAKADIPFVSLATAVEWF